MTTNQQPEIIHKSPSSFLLPWLVCLSASLLFFYEILQLAIFNTASQELIKYFTLSTAQLSQLSATYLYACAFFLIPAGLLLDRFSTKIILGSVSLLCTLGVYFLAITHSIEVAFIGRILTGIGNAFVFLGCMRLVSSWHSQKQLALAMGLVVTIGMLGGVVSQTPFHLLISSLGWQNSMLVNAVVGACITLLIFLVVRDAPIEKDQEKTGRINQNPISFWVSIKLSCRNYQNWLCGIYTGCLNLPIMVLGALWGNLYLTQGRGFSSLAASNIISLLFIGLIIGAPLMGCLSDKLKSRRLPMLLSALLILLTITIVIGTRPSHILFSLLFFFMGILSGAQVLSYPIISESNPRHLESTSLGLVAVIVNIGGAFSQTLFSWMMNSKLKEAIEHFHQAINSYEFALFILPLAFIISFISAFLIKEFRQKSPT